MTSQANNPRGIVAAGHQITADAAAEILADGGNAFDAALAGLLASCVCEPVLSSPGGGGHLMARATSTGKTLLYDFFVDTPRAKRPSSEIDFRAVTVDFGPATQDFHVGAAAAATPGFIPGIFAIHDDLATLPMSRIAEPAIRAASDGVAINPFQAYLFSIVEPLLSPEARALIFANENGELLSISQTKTNVALAGTLEALAREGADLFVRGEVGQAILAQSHQYGGHLTREDLENYRVERRCPLEHSYRGHAFALNPAPAAGGPLIAFSLALLEALGPACPVAPVALARVMAVTNEVRSNHLGALDGILHPEIIARHLDVALAHAPSHRGTTHISVIDRDGNAAAATVSNGEGNGMLVGDNGFLLNNMLGEEDLNPSGFGKWQPGTRMSTMMAPTLITSPGGTVTALGSGGSNRIRSAILQVALNLIDHEMPPDAAVAAPRMHVEKCGTLSFEDNFDGGTRADLIAAFADSHPWPEPNMFFGGTHIARRNRVGHLEGAGDPRRSGISVVVE